MTEQRHLGALPPIGDGSPRQVSWARDIRERFVRARWRDRWHSVANDPAWAAVLRQTSARWWIDNRDRIASALAEPAAAPPSARGAGPARRGPAPNRLPPMAGGTEQARRRATRIRAGLVAKRWGDEIPPGVLAALRRLTDAEWWIRNEVGDGRPQAIDRALGDEVPEHDRRRMALPGYGPAGPPRAAHAGRCEDQPAYAAAFAKALATAARTGDSRTYAFDDGPRITGASCCLVKGSSQGGREGKRRWLENRAAEIRRGHGWFRRPTPEQAMAQARAELARWERTLDGWG